MIDDAVANEDYESAAVYEAQRNAKISGEGIKDYAPTYNWQDYLPGAGQKKQTSGYEKYTQQAADFDNAIAEVLGRIGSRQPFSYDAESDPMYQIHKEQYTRNGQKAMQDTLAQVSARTGGLASSFAEQAAQGTFNDYMDRLNGEIPELRNLAYSMYNQEFGNDMDYLKLLTAQQQQAIENARAERQWQYQMDEDVQKQARAEVDSILKNGGSVANIPQELRDLAGYSDAYLNSGEAAYMLSQTKKTAGSGGGGGGGGYYGGGSGGGTWSAVEDWVSKYGPDAAEDYIKENYKQLGYSSQSAALAGWNNHLLETGDSGIDEKDGGSGGGGGGGHGSGGSTGEGIIDTMLGFNDKNKAYEYLLGLGMTNSKTDQLWNLYLEALDSAESNPDGGVTTMDDALAMLQQYGITGGSGITDVQKIGTAQGDGALRWNGKNYSISKYGLNQMISDINNANLSDEDVNSIIARLRYLGYNAG